LVIFRPVIDQLVRRLLAVVSAREDRAVTLNTSPSPRARSQFAGNIDPLEMAGLASRFCHCHAFHGAATNQEAVTARVRIRQSSSRREQQDDQQVVARVKVRCCGWTIADHPEAIYEGNGRD
jgi:hypothetical protein